MSHWFYNIISFGGRALPAPVAELGSFGGREHATRTQTMKHQFTVFTISSLLLCLAGCGKPVEESSLVGAWQFDVQHTIMVLDASHAYTLKADDGRTTLGEWRLEGHRLITVGQMWTNQSTAIRLSDTNDTRITELTDSRMVLQNWGGPVSRLTKVVPAH